MKNIKTLALTLSLCVTLCASSQKSASKAVGGNPILPGYYADPSVKKFGDTYYIYATTDGIKLASGAPSVWVSKDFVNWYNYELKLQIPEGLTNCWAPDVFQGADGKYYYYMGNCEWGCNIYGYVSDSPMGPFAPLNNGQPVIPAGTAKENLPALDAQCLVDDDGSIYSYFGTWCTSFGGIGVAKINSKDMYTIEQTSFIPINQVPKAFEASYPIKRNGKYFLMYSSGDCRLSSYAVHYSVGDSPEGPFRPGKNSPILVTNEDGTIDGPGHHAVLKDGDNYYILYHRHDNPRSTNGEFRQVCADKLVFADNETIEKVVPTHSGIGYLGENQVKAPNLAYHAKASASSSYHLVAQKTRYSNGDYNYQYAPENAVDDNNGTLWKAATSDMPQSLTIDLGKAKAVKRVMTQFEYPTFYYQYKIEVSTDNKNWKLFSDRTANRQCGSPMIDDGFDKITNQKARYVKLTVTGTEKTGLLAAIWNIKVYDKLFDVPAFQNTPKTAGPGTVSTKSLLVDLDANTLKMGELVEPIANKGTLGGEFEIVGKPTVETIDGVKAIRFDGESFLQLSKKAPASLDWNAPFTVSAWVYNPEIGPGECITTWTSRENMLQSTYAALMYGSGNYGAVAHGDGAVDLPYKQVPAKGQWHHIVLTFDGMLENVYVDGQLNTQTPISLYVEKGDILIGASGEPSENFSGYISKVQLFDKVVEDAASCQPPASGR
jgi:beta-xylosidase